MKVGKDMWRRKHKGNLKRYLYCVVSCLTFVAIGSTTLNVPKLQAASARDQLIVPVLTTPKSDPSMTRQPHRRETPIATRKHLTEQQAESQQIFKQSSMLNRHINLLGIRTSS